MCLQFPAVTTQHRTYHMKQIKDFFEAIDMLFLEINNEKKANQQKPKFRHIINRLKTKCAICFGKVKRGETVCRTQCGHKFHKDCLENWTQRNPTCPLCRGKFK